MLFGLKNVRATYQRLVNSMFSHQIGKMMEVCVDDMLVKSTHAEMIDILRKHETKLNPRKYTFCVSSGKFLSYIVNNKGIEANPKKIRTIIEMKALTRLKEV